MDIVPGSYFEGGGTVWSVKEALGRGTFSNVYKVSSVDDDRIFAMKVYKPEEKYTQSGEKELRILQHLHQRKKQSNSSRISEYQI